MSFLAVFFTLFFLIYIVWGAVSGLEDKPYMKRPEDRSIRMPVGSWFADHFRRRRPYGRPHPRTRGSRLKESGQPSLAHARGGVTMPSS